MGERVCARITPITFAAHLVAARAPALVHAVDHAADAARAAAAAVLSRPAEVAVTARLREGAPRDEEPWANAEQSLFRCAHHSAVGASRVT